MHSSDQVFSLSFYYLKRRITKGSADYFRETPASITNSSFQRFSPFVELIEEIDEMVSGQIERIHITNGLVLKEIALKCDELNEQYTYDLT